MYCNECGTKNDPNAQACSNCSLNLVKSNPFSPYNPPINSGFLSAAGLLFGPALLLILYAMQSAVQYVLPEGYDEPQLKFDASLMGGMQIGLLVVAAIFAAAGVVAALKSRDADRFRAQDNLPAAAQAALEANKMSKFGWFVGCPCMAILIIVSFMDFVSGSGVREANELLGVGEVAAESAPATDPAASGDAAAPAGDAVAPAGDAPAAAAPAAAAPAAAAPAAPANE